VLPSTTITLFRNIFTYLQIENDFLQDITSSMAPKSTTEAYSFSDLCSESFPITESLFLDFQENSKNNLKLTDHKDDLTVNIISFDAFQDHPSNWSVLYSLSLPGFDLESGLALIQASAYCKAGPPNFASFYLLKQTKEKWEVTHTFGIYNQ
jgi:hypothetical protein